MRHRLLPAELVDHFFFCHCLDIHSPVCAIRIMARSIKQTKNSIHDTYALQYSREREKKNNVNTVVCKYYSIQHNTYTY